MNGQDARLIFRFEDETHNQHQNAIYNVRENGGTSSNNSSRNNRNGSSNESTSPGTQRNL